jgi:hypothetical protein
MRGSRERANSTGRATTGSANAAPASAVMTTALGDVPAPAQWTARANATGSGGRQGGGR